MLDFDPNRVAVVPRPAATVILLRDAAQGLEVCVMQRSNQSSFMGGAIVFPGGRVEESDASPAWTERACFPTSMVDATAQGRWWDPEGVAARIAACRETLEEVGILLCEGDLPSTARIEELRTAGDLRAAMQDERLDLAALHPLARWVTPEAERRRFDARFFLARAPRAQEGKSDQKEATRVFWSSPRALLDDFEKGAVALFPPTHHTLDALLAFATVDQALAAARTASLEIVCPRFLVEDGQPVLALPGDPLHEVAQPRIAGASRYVLHDAKWLPRQAK